eukprot:TRINITY_DN2601_c0_g2_i1.p1 TRINITY_DN2601_c0_g2~~TRINITY_DN2601_c0_g2_i1.p1  ORF type:complete len:316 (+),score=27.00 TRINITY_DN2601_c0_g2_i1:117-1064(+)
MSDDMNKKEDGSLMELVHSVNKQSFLTAQEIQQIVSQNNLNPRNQSNACKGCSKESILWTDKRQGIVLADKTQSGGILLGITAKAAGFVIGPHGASIRDICMKSNVWSTSWLCHYSLSEDMSSIPLRMVIIEGVFSAIQMTVDIIQKAVERYTALVQGSVPDLMQKVSSEQIIDGIKFEYKPPPLTEMNRAVRTTRTDPTKRRMLLSPKGSSKFSSANSDSSYSVDVGTEAFTPRQHLQQINVYNLSQMQSLPAANVYPQYYYNQNPPYILYQQSPRQQIAPYWMLDYDYAAPNPEYVQHTRVMYPNIPPYNMYY